ncbi:MAG: EMC3/TMCO1 family protein [Nitrososphaera sp.]
MTAIDNLIMQWPFAPQYTENPIFPDPVSATIVALIIAVAMNFAFAILRKKTTDIEKMNRVMKETTEWRKQYTDAIKKQDKARIDELKKRQAYVNKMALEMQQQQMRPMFIYMIPSFMIWIFLFPSIFGGTVSLSPVFIPWIMCADDNVQNDMQLRNQTDPGSGPTGPCRIPGEVYLWGWFLITSFGFSGIISKVTKTGMPSMT